MIGKWFSCNPFLIFDFNQKITSKKNPYHCIKFWFSYSYQSQKLKGNPV
jgi:hypothetical protein